MQGLTLADITARETHLTTKLELNNARLDVKSQQSHSSTKSRSRAPSACLKSMSRTITMQGLIFSPITLQRNTL